MFSPSGALAFILAELKPGVKVYDLCVKGDKFMEECADLRPRLPACLAQSGRCQGLELAATTRTCSLCLPGERHDAR